jgi:hypothetical protein
MKSGGEKLLKYHQEELISNFKGTIIDIETIGEFNRFNDSRRYRNITPVIFGYINREKLKIICAENKNSIELEKQEVKRLLHELEKPFYAFNSIFEKGVLFHFLETPVEFRELNKERYENKEKAVRLLGISKYDDPFNGNGKLCMQAWLRGDLKMAIAHNRACLLKERDILLKRGFKEPDELELRRE